jgi:hypothetical protein
MRPRLTIPLTPEDKVACALWSSRVLGIWVLIVIATLSLPFSAASQRRFHTIGHGTRRQSGRNFLQRLCTASQAIQL